MFSVIADETADVATICVRNVGCLCIAICVRYVDQPDGANSESIPVVREDVIGLVSPADATGKHLAAQAILGKLREVTLDVRWVRDQGYDGGNNMSGMIRGAQRKICTVQPLPTHTH